MSRSLFVRGFFAGYQAIIHGGHFSVLVIAVNFSRGIQEERSFAGFWVGLGSGRQFEIIVVSIRVRRNAVAENVAVVFSRRHVRRHQRRLKKSRDGNVARVFFPPPCPPAPAPPDPERSDLSAPAPAAPAIPAIC